MTIPQLPAALTDPRPVIAIGTTVWGIATTVVLLSWPRWENVLPTCYNGLALGIVGSGIFLLQRRSARLGVKGAQTGLV
ncbi:MAG: DUF2530 domain-containing protein [Mycobacteriaceae bacterium]